MNTRIEYMAGSELKVFDLPPGVWSVVYNYDEKSVYVYHQTGKTKELVGVFNNVQHLWRA